MDLQYQPSIGTVPPPPGKRKERPFLNDRPSRSVALSPLFPLATENVLCREVVQNLCQSDSLKRVRFTTTTYTHRPECEPRFDRANFAR
jgi:hypothetical protein